MVDGASAFVCSVHLFCKLQTELTRCKVLTGRRISRFWPETHSFIRDFGVRTQDSLCSLFAQLRKTIFFGEKFAPRRFLFTPSRGRSFLARKRLQACAHKIRSTGGTSKTHDARTMNISPRKSCSLRAYLNDVSFAVDWGNSGAVELDAFLMNYKHHPKSINDFFASLDPVENVHGMSCAFPCSDVTLDTDDVTAKSREQIFRSPLKIKMNAEPTAAHSTGKGVHSVKIQKKSSTFKTVRSPNEERRRLQNREAQRRYREKNLLESYRKLTQITAFHYHPMH